MFFCHPTCSSRALNGNTVVMAVVKMLYVMSIASNNDEGVDVDGLRSGECLWKTRLRDAVKLLQMI